MHFKVSLNPRNTSATAACIRTFPMDYSYGGTGGVGTSGTLAHPFEALDQSSIYAKFVSNPVFNPGVSELRLYGNRKSYSANPAFLNNVSGIRSNVSVYDFLTINNQSVADGNTIDVVISGSYLTNHKTVPTD